MRPLIMTAAATSTAPPPTRMPAAQYLDTVCTLCSSSAVLPPGSPFMNKPDLRTQQSNNKMDVQLRMSPHTQQLSSAHNTQSQQRAWWCHKQYTNAYGVRTPKVLRNQVVVESPACRRAPSVSAGPARQEERGECAQKSSDTTHIRTGLVTSIAAAVAQSTWAPRDARRTATTAGMAGASSVQPSSRGAACTYILFRQVSVPSSVGTVPVSEL